MKTDAKLPYIHCHNGCLYDPASGIWISLNPNCAMTKFEPGGRCFSPSVYGQTLSKGEPPKTASEILGPKVHPEIVEPKLHGFCLRPFHLVGIPNLKTVFCTLYENHYGPCEGGPGSRAKGCPIRSHASDCDCDGAGGDR